MEGQSPGATPPLCRGSRATWVGVRVSGGCGDPPLTRSGPLSATAIRPRRALPLPTPPAPGRGPPTARCTRDLCPHGVNAASRDRGDAGHHVTGQCGSYGAWRPVPSSSLSTSAGSRGGAWKTATTQNSGPQGQWKTTCQEQKECQQWRRRKSRPADRAAGNSPCSGL